MSTQAPATPPSLGTTVVSTPDDTSIVITRSFKAPRDLIFDLWNDPELIPEFWGPSTHSNVVEEWDLRPGGAWRIVSTLANGTAIDFHGEFIRVERPSLVEWPFGFNDIPPTPETLFIDEVDGITTMRSLTILPTREIRDMVLGTGMEAGAAESHDRFEVVLARHLAD